MTQRPAGLRLAAARRRVLAGVTAMGTSGLAARRPLAAGEAVTTGISLDLGH